MGSAGQHSQDALVGGSGLGAWLVEPAFCVCLGPGEKRTVSWIAVTDAPQKQASEKVPEKEDQKRWWGVLGLKT